MIISEFKQLSDEWFCERAGLPTASNFDKIVTSKGEPSKQAKKYMYQLAGECITGQKEESYTNSAMQRGIELEDEARSLYEIATGYSVETVGLCWKDDKKLVGASPDGLINDPEGVEGCLEIKCPSMAVHVEYLLADKLPTAYFQQVHGQMYVTGALYCSFVSYYPGMKPLIYRVERDEEFMGKLESELDKFCNELKETTRRLA